MESLETGGLDLPFQMEVLIFAMKALPVIFGLFFAILFLQSGIDKITDRKGNESWLTTHFSKSPLAGMAPVLLTLITILEVASGFVCAVGVIFSLVGEGGWLVTIGLLLSTASIISLFFGQRMAKDYAGAAALVPYFIAAVAGILFAGYGGMMSMMPGL